jgi:hypothetical protein
MVKGNRMFDRPFMGLLGSLQEIHDAHLAGNGFREGRHRWLSIGRPEAEECISYLMLRDLLLWTKRRASSSQCSAPTRAALFCARETFRPMLRA